MTALAESRSNAQNFPWWLILIEGIIILILGLLLVSAPGAGLVVLVRALGWYWLIAGILSFVSIFTRESDSHWGWLALHGVLGVVAGFYVLDHPLLATILLPAVLVTLMGIQGVIIGVIRVILAFMGAGWGSGILGVMSILFGGILLSSPLIAASALAIVLGVFAIVGGILSIILAFRKRTT